MRLVYGTLFWLSVWSQTLTVTSGHQSRLHLVSQPKYEWYLHLEEEMIDFCRTVIDQEYNLYRADELHDFSHVLRFLEAAKKHSDDTMLRELNIIENPLAMFQVKRWLVDKWPSILTQMEESKFIRKQPALSMQLNRLSTAVGDLDLDALVQELILLMKIYDLTVPGLVGGSFGPAQDIPLSQEDIIQFVESANELGEHKLAVELLLCGLRNGPVSSMSTERQLYYNNTLASTYLKLGAYEEARQIYLSLLDGDPTNRAATSNIRLLEHKSRSNRSTSDPDSGRSALVDDVRKYCTGHLSIPTSNESKLLCRERVLRRSGQMMRVEELSRSPGILLVYDVFDDYRIRILLERAANKLWEVYNKLSDDSTPQRDDPVDTDWMDFYSIRLKNITFKNIPKWRKRNGTLSWIKVTNYGAGLREGMFYNETERLHYAPVKHKMAQYYIFLNEPMHGGQLVFPNIDLRIPAVKGAAVFWQMSKDDGRSADTRLNTIIQCPVLVGHQWVAFSGVQHGSKQRG